MSQPSIEDPQTAGSGSQVPEQDNNYKHVTVEEEEDQQLESFPSPSSPEPITKSEEINGSSTASESAPSEPLATPTMKEPESSANGTTASLKSVNTEDLANTSANIKTLHSASNSMSRVRNGSTASSTISSLKRRASSTVNESAIILFIKKSLENIIAIKEINRKHPDVLKTATKAIEILKTGVLPDEATIFAPLKLSCEKSNVEAKIEALDCLGKIFTFNVFNQPIYIEYKKSKPDLKTDADMDSHVDNNNTTPTEESMTDNKLLLIDAAVQVIISCFDGEGTDERVELQVIRVLTGAIVNETMPVHGKILLQAIRQIYNIFLLSLSPINQGIAQATLTQIINTVFSKVKDSKKSADDAQSMQPVDLSEPVLSQETPDNTDKKLTLKEMEASIVAGGNDGVQFTDDEIFGDSRELYIKDSFLIFRSMSNLAVKIIEADSIDMRSHAMRSKLLSLHIIHWILKNHIECFLDKDCLIVNKTTSEKTALVDATRKYLCLILSRNAASQIAPVYEISLEIYWIMISQLRDEFKVQIPVFLEEIYLPIGEMRTSTSHQKRYLLEIILRVCQDPKAIIELYLNYDCDANMTNICERLMDYLDRLALTRADATVAQKVNYRESLTRSLATYPLNSVPQLNVSKLGGHPPNPDANLNFPIDYGLKMGSIKCIVSFLNSLNSFSGKPLMSVVPTDEALNNNSSSTTALSVPGANAHGHSLSILTQNHRSSSVGSLGQQPMSPDVSSASLLGLTATATTEGSEDVSQFDTVKQRKTALIEAVRSFNFKPKRGIQQLIKQKFIENDEPKSIAKFLLEIDSLNKAAIGEYLGEGDEKNIAIMHAFVDLMDFRDRQFLDALRYYLDHFRLPGESQKIDRFMLKFAEKYVTDNPDNVFANAEAVYVLSYSVIMLNTDQHNNQVKSPMTLDGFIANNRGINNNSDFPREFLEGIYRDIQTNEIKLSSEQHAYLISNNFQPTQQSAGLFSGRDLVKEAYSKASKEMSSKTEEAVKLLSRSARNDSKTVFYSAAIENNPEYVRSIFDNIWMSVLAGLTAPFREYDDEDTARSLLEGIKISIHIACVFGLADARTSFIRALLQFCNFNNPEELKMKNISAIFVLLEIGIDENSYLSKSWKDVLIAISQIERLKLLAQGVDSEALPDLLNARLANRTSMDSSRSNNSGGWFGKRQTISEQAFQHHINQKLSSEIISKISFTELDVAIDKVFAKSSEIEGDGIFDFIAALSDVARDEIDSSGQSTQPRMFSLQKMVDVCYYNMGRIRVQWSALWAVMNQRFNEFGCHSNTVIAFFAIDSLRQLSERFFDIEELSHFKFQKNFLKPFNYVISKNPNLQVKEMVLDCVQVMIHKKADSIRSGWTTLLEILTTAANESNENIVAKGFQCSNMIGKDYFDPVFKQDGFEHLAICLTEYAKNEQFQRTSLQALQSMRKIERLISQRTTDTIDEATLTQLWFPLLFGFHDIIMGGDDLEVREKALKYMFEALVENGGHFKVEFWDKICRELLFPIFGILSTHWEINANEEDPVWLSTTLIQALRNMIGLFTHYFEAMSALLDGYLELLISCICQENESISKIGIACYKDLIVTNIVKFDSSHWEKINGAFATLFELTTAKELFLADPLRKTGNGNSDFGEEHRNTRAASEFDDDDDEEEEDQVSVISTDGAMESDHTVFVSTADSKNSLEKSQEKSNIVIKCVLQLHMIQIISELFDNDEFYNNVPVDNLLQLTKLLEKSYKFSKEFNEDYNLRVRIWNSGVIDRLPNLLKQETASSGVFISVLFRLYCDDEKVNPETRKLITSTLIPLCVSILQRFVSLDELEQSRNIQSWRPVIVEILQASSEFDDEDFVRCCPDLYDLISMLFDKSLTDDMRRSMKGFFVRVGEVYINDGHHGHQQQNGKREE